MTIFMLFQLLDLYDYNEVNQIINGYYDIGQYIFPMLYMAIDKVEIATIQRVRLTLKLK